MVGALLPDQGSNLDSFRSNRNMLPLTLSGNIETANVEKMS